QPALWFSTCATRSSGGRVPPATLPRILTRSENRSSSVICCSVRRARTSASDSCENACTLPMIRGSPATDESNLFMSSSLGSSASSAAVEVPHTRPCRRGWVACSSLSKLRGWGQRGSRRDNSLANGNQTQACGYFDYPHSDPSCSASDGALLFHLLSPLYERTSVVITTNLSFS